MSDISRYPYSPNADYPAPSSGAITTGAMGPITNAAVQAVWRRLNRIFRTNFNARMPMEYFGADRDHGADRWDLASSTTGSGSSRT